MEYLLLFIKSFLIAFSGAVMPGPLLAFIIVQASKRGFWTSPVAIIGHSILELGVVIGLIFGLGKFLGMNNVQGVIGLAGGSFLIYMGIAMIRGIPKITLTLDAEKPENARRIENPVVGGILISLSNPYWTIWWAVVGLALITEAQAIGTAGIGSFYIGHILGDFVWYAFIALMITAGRRFISDKVYRGIIFICAVFILVLGALFIRSGIFRLFVNG